MTQAKDVRILCLSMKAVSVGRITITSFGEIVMIKVRLDGERVILSTDLSQIAISKAQGKQLAAQLRKLCTTATKYGNKRITAHGRDWDSKAELDFYDHLLQLHRAEDITIQPKFTLQDKVYHGKNDPRNMLAITYAADFQVGALVFDVKGMETQQGKMRVKMFKARYPDLCLSLVNKCPKKYQSIYGRWIDIGVLNKLRSAAKRAIKKAKNEVK